MKNVIEALKELNIEIISSSDDAILVDADNNYFDYDNEDMSIDEDVVEILEDNLCQAYFVAVNILKITKA
tara:strand:+ start:1097 stop:1306 length:210 start_codon:yes stop_codon:yes gene_type:complete